MLRYVSGDFFEYNADIRINTVNCVGVMGAGVALAFKNRYPEMYKGYVEQCEKGNLSPSQPWVWKGVDMFSGSVEVINLATKKHWRNPSKYIYVEEGLKWLAVYLSDKCDSVVTLPALGCGHGGLDWVVVRELIERYLADVPAEVLVFEPKSSRDISKPMPANGLVDLCLSSDVEMISSSSDCFPELLRRFTNKELFVYPRESGALRFDFSVVCGSKPEPFECELVERFVIFCLKRNKSVVLGGSAFEKKLALTYAAKGLDVSCFLPSGILKAVHKLKERSNNSLPRLLSIGDPLKDFDRSEYLPSVLARIYAPAAVVFFAYRLSWLSKFNRKILNNEIRAYYMEYEWLGSDDRVSIRDAGGVPTDINVFENDVQLSKFFCGSV
ncbi:hypothetical protein EIG75_24215 [Pseudomonas syringae]|uniref:Macro domain-containing protein n=1 Tax=Pseudomonas syringae TaxID=317 RepID=A0A6B2B1R1_PSESX|nr:macro domain-containing protein [Pseudomonas syringae]MDC6491898.1 macro domain-containing protein [Pseudomonas syringae]MDC6501807.1 macro domain-containing protein [Pseudomonas syringae]MDC6512366.1 macro domain-containing protein [Pseudomonas syringae]MDC6533247.1 macro domain-containing protein [Pseudomonas syringae]MDC6554837.1 macro domain-containing protein [Pseudomonas syringae]